MKLALACANDPTADVEFWLAEEGGVIKLKARKPGVPKGYGFYILGIYPDGTLQRYSSIGSTGLSVNKKGVIELADGG